MSTKKPPSRSQVMDLYLHVAGLLGLQSDRDIAQLADVSIDNVANWKSGAVQEFKPVTLKAVKENLVARLGALQEQLRLTDAAHDVGLVLLEIDEDSGPAALQRKFLDRVTYDYLGHRFLYYEPQGALAWENLMKGGYDQGCWLTGIETCARAWFKPDDTGTGGAIGRALGLGHKAQAKGLDVISLGPGEGSKEQILLAHLVAMQRASRQPLSWLTLGLVDVSVPLLLKAAKAARAALRSEGDAGVGPDPRDGGGTAVVLPFCADFEEGRLTFMRRLPTATRESPAGVRLVLMLGNVFGNLRGEDAFVRERLLSMLRPGDLMWLEVGLRLERIEDDPIYRMTLPHDDVTAAEANRRLLLEGPYRRWEAATGRKATEVFTRVWVREDDDTSEIPGSLNFCHDLVIQSERRACTMLYSRRYEVAGLSRWLEARGLHVEEVVRVEDSSRRARVAHLLVRRR